MSSSSNCKLPLAVFYGHGEVAVLQRFQRVVLQALHYSDDDVNALKTAQTSPLAYLSLGEDVGGAAPWQRSECNLAWYGHYVQAAHPGWSVQVLQTAQALLSRGFEGFLLDTLDTVDLFLEDRGAYLQLVADLRRLTPGGYLLANRGFSLLPELAEHLDGILFESFSSTWQADGTTGMLPKSDLEINAARVSELGRFGLDLYALDYADTPALEAIARDRAQANGLVPLISNRELTKLCF